jgi:urease accessory protein
MLHALPLPAASLQRTRGDARVALAGTAARPRLAELYQSGAGKAFLPRVHGPEPEVVFLNTAGGLTGGDTLAYALAVGAGLRVTGTTQTAERAYASRDGHAEVRVTLSAGPGARLDWLPQETILFQDAALQRHTTIDLAADATCLYAECVILGRAAMGETLTRLAFRDTRTVTRQGRPVLVEALALDDDVLADASPALLRGARAFATVALVAPDAEDALGPVRRVLGEAEGTEEGVEAAASAWDGRCLVRVLAPGGFALRRQVARVLEVLRDRTPPRVWQL